MVFLCSFATSSYSRICFLASKCKLSTFFCAFSMALVIRPLSMLSPSSTPNLSIIFLIFVEPKILNKLSSKLKKKRLMPGSPPRPLRPRSWLSMRRLSCLSVPIIYSPPRARTSSFMRISTPRPAIFVATVTAPFAPAVCMICASFSWFLAFSTLCAIFSFTKSLCKISLFSMLAVPTSTGWPLAFADFISSITALNFSFSLL